MLKQVKTKKTSGRISQRLQKPSKIIKNRSQKGKVYQSLYKCAQRGVGALSFYVKTSIAVPIPPLKQIILEPAICIAPLQRCVGMPIFYRGFWRLFQKPMCFYMVLKGFRRFWICFHGILTGFYRFSIGFIVFYDRVFIGFRQVLIGFDKCLRFLIGVHRFSIGFHRFLVGIYRFWLGFYKFLVGFYRSLISFYSF